MWVCPNCGQGNERLFCVRCGTAKDATQSTAIDSRTAPHITVLEDRNQGVQQMNHLVSSASRGSGSGRPLTHLFNRNMFDRSDPAQSIGVNLPGFSLYHLYSDIDQQKLSKVSQEVYDRVVHKLQSTAPKHVSFMVVNYADHKYRALEGTRDYIIVTRETPRKTRATILARCLTHGNNLYVGVESYVLGSLDKWGLLRRVLFSLIPLLLLLCPLAFAIPAVIRSLTAGPFGDPGPGIASALGPTICCAIPLFIFIIFLWLDVIRGFSQHKDLPLALRESFSRLPTDESFNIDDIFMFYKSILPSVIYSVKEVFNENGIDVRTLDEFIANVNNINNINQTFNNNTPNQGAQGVMTGSVTTNNPSIAKD